MSFGLGSSTLFSSTSTPSLSLNATAAANKPTGFGTSFFNTPASSAPGTFGLGTNTATPSTGFGFGSTANTGFGTTSSSGFGTTASTTGFGPTLGTGFGNATGSGTGTGTNFGTAAGAGFGTAPAASNFGTATGSGFGTTPASGFGTSAPASGFGTGTTGGFGTAPSSGFGLGGFGGNTSTTSTSTGLGGFGTFGGPTSTVGSGTGFGNLGGFGTTSTANTGLSTGLFGSGGFGTTSSTAAAGTSAFGGFGTGGFGTKPSTSGWGGMGTFGQPAGQQQQTPFGQPQLQFQQQQQQQQLDPDQALYNSVFNCQMFGDERDRTLSRWNLVQALWGTGKGYYSQQALPVDYDLKNPLCRFKAISYSLKPKTENKDGFVALVFNKRESEVRALESQLSMHLNSILGNKPNLAPGIESIRPFSDSKTIVVVFVQEKTATNIFKKILASELSNYLTQPMQRQQLQNLQVENVYPQVDPGQEQLKEYLDNPPQGFDARLWKQAQDDNPNPEKLIPVPLIGFADVRWRMKCQEKETALHQAFLDKIADEIADLQRKHTETLAKISEYRLRYSELQHRILKVMIIQEISRKMGLSLLPEEEKLKSRLESVSTTVNSAPFKSRLTKLIEAVKSHSKSNKEPQRYKMDSDVIAEIKQFLTMEQSGMTHVMDTIQSDLTDLKRIKDGMMRILQGHV